MSYFITDFKHGVPFEEMEVEMTFVAEGTYGREFGEETDAHWSQDLVVTDLRVAWLTSDDRFLEVPPEWLTADFWYRATDEAVREIRRLETT